MAWRVDRGATRDDRQRRAFQRAHAGVDPLGIPILAETPPNVQEGDLWYDDQFKSIRMWVAGEKLTLGGQVVLSRDSAYIQNVTAETLFDLKWEAGTGTLVNKRCLTFEASGNYSTTGTPTLRLKLKANNKVLYDLTAITLGTGVTNQPWYVHFTVILHNSTADSIEALTCLDDARYAADYISDIEQEQTIGIKDQVFGLSATWSAASASNKIRMRRFRVMMF